MLKSLVALALILFFASFAVRSHYAAMLMYWWFGIFRPHEWMWWDLSSLRLPLMAAALFFIPAILSGKWPSLNNSIAKLMVLYFLYSLVPEFLVSCDFDKPRTLKIAAILVVAALLTTRFIRNRGGLLFALFLTAFSLNAHTFKAGILSAVTGSSLYDIDFGGGSFTGTNASAMGAAISLFFIIFTLQVVRYSAASALLPKLLNAHVVKLGLRITLYLIIVGSVYFIIATQSRGSALAFGGALFIWMLLHARKVMVVVSSAILVSSALLLVGLPDDYSDRLTSAFAAEEDLDNSAASRPHFWEVARIMAANHPTGVGIGCYQAYYNRYDISDGQYGSRRSVHSSHFGVIAELGYFGFLLWCLLFIATYVHQFKVRNAARATIKTDINSWFYFYAANSLIAAQTVFILGGNFYEMAYNDYTWLVFGFTIVLSRLYFQGESATQEATIQRRPPLQRPVQRPLQAKHQQAHPHNKLQTRQPARRPQRRF